MTLPLILLCIFAALLELDTTYAFQTLLSRPVIAGPIFGWLTGDVAAGIQVGIFAELLFSDISPLGGIIPPQRRGGHRHSASFIRPGHRFIFRLLFRRMCSGAVFVF